MYGEVMDKSSPQANPEQVIQVDESKDWAQEFGPSVEIFTALAHPLRLALAYHLMDREHSVSELHTCLGVSQPLASHHLRILLDANVVERETHGRVNVYRLKDHHISHIIADVYTHTKEH